MDRLHRHCLIMQQPPVWSIAQGSFRNMARAGFRDIRALKSRRSVRACRSVFEGDDMVTALRPIEVRRAAADEVPKVAAMLADAFISDPVFTFLRPGRLGRRVQLPLGD